MIARIIELSSEELKDLFEYNGDLIWKKTNGMAKEGKIAGTVNSRGYRHIRINGRFYQSHRLVWLWHGNSLNENDVIDHIDRNKLNNNIDNLRVLSNAENCRNSARCDRPNVGVWLEGKKYTSWYRYDGKRHYIGRYTTEDEAIKARQAFIKLFHLV